MAQRQMTHAETGARLLKASSRISGLLAGGDEAFPFPNFAGVGRGSRVSPDLLPLPLPPLPLASGTELESMFPAGAAPTTEGFKYGARAWLQLVVYALNQMYTGSARPGPGPPSEAQAKAIDLLYEDCGELCRDSKSRTLHEWPAAYKAKENAYWGEPVYTATPLTLAQVLPTLPPPGVAASVDITEVLRGQVLAQLLDPESLLLPMDQWPEVPPRASTQMRDPREYKELANELWSRGLCIWLPTSAIFSPGGIPVISGLFGVEKPKCVPGHPDLQQLRLICNLVPCNSYFRVIRGDIDGLPYALQWNAIVLLDDEFLLISQEDMTCAFYLFKLPAAWAKYFAIGQPVRLDELKGNPAQRSASLKAAKGHDCSGLGHLCLITLPMGWASATGVMQAVHRAILVRKPGKGEPLPTASEIRKTSVLPTEADQRFHRGWQVYLDNFALLSVTQRAHLERAQVEVDRWHQAARAAWAHWGIPSAADKSLSNALVATELGCESRPVGTLATTRERRLHGISIALHLIGCSRPHRMWLATGAGCWNFILQFRRPASCVLSRTWQLISRWEEAGQLYRLPKDVCRELLLAIYLAPVLVAKLRAKPDVLLTCSDASHSGAGVAGTAGLTELGVHSATSLPRSLPPAVEKGFAVISMFAGIDALRRALDLLGVRPVRHIAIELDTAANRNTAELYPDVVIFRDITTTSRDDLHVALSGCEITFILAMGGSPCQGLSGVNVQRSGFDDPRSQLLFHMLRIIQDMIDEKHEVRYCAENVASMSEEDKKVFSKLLRVQPHRACSRGISHNRRARYFWLSWLFSAGPGVLISQRESHLAVDFEATRAEPKHWTDPGWQWCGAPEYSLPSFIRSAPRKSPGLLPAGLASTPADARRRWQADKHRFPPYQYKKEFCFRPLSGGRRLRVASIWEREVLMFLGRGYTSHCWNPVKAKADPTGYEDARLSLVGNSFNAGVVALLLAPLFVAEGYLAVRPTPDDLVLRMGLRPGETFREGLDCSLRRPTVRARHDGSLRGVVQPSAQAAREAVSAESTPELEKLLLHNLVRSADYRGSDVRLDSGELYRPAAWPRRSIDTGKWVWYTIVAHEYTKPEHINVLELRSTLLALRWRTRSSNRVFSRFVHLLDSQVALAVLVKGRSSSDLLNHVVKKIGALTIAASLMPSYGYTSSQWNPSDSSSRFWEGRRQSRSSYPRRSRVPIRKERSPKAQTRSRASAAAASDPAPPNRPEQIPPAGETRHPSSIASGLPPGLVIGTLKPAGLLAAALRELRQSVRWTRQSPNSSSSLLEMGISFSEFEARKILVPAFPISDFPRVRRVLKTVTRLLGDPHDIDARGLNVICRWYSSGAGLAPHRDRPDLFGERVYGCILDNTSDSGLEFTSSATSSPIALPETPGLCFVQSGPARFDFTHEVRKLSTGRRISVTWRWYSATALRSNRNVDYTKDFDSTLGYPGEGPARRKRGKRGPIRPNDLRKMEPRRKVGVKKGTERVIVRRTQMERHLARRGVSLRDQAISSVTRRLYREAFKALWTWAGRAPPAFLQSIAAYDGILAEFIARSWEVGSTRGEAGNALSGSISAYPELRGRGKLTESWFLLNCWAKLEVPCRAPPLPALVVFGMIHWFLLRGHDAVAFLVAAGFESFLRTREMLSLTWADFQVGESSGVISLAHTKTGQRSASFEASTMSDPAVLALYRRARATCAAGTGEDFYVFAGNESRFYELFAAALRDLGLSEFGFRPYSLRRGGATAFYRASANMQATIERGRWSSARVARIYINDGLAKEIELKLPPAVTSQLRGRSAAVLAALRG